MQVRSLGWEDPLEKEMKTTPVFLPREYHGQSSLGELQSMGLQSIGHIWPTEHTIKKKQNQKQHTGFQRLSVKKEWEWYP